MSKTITRKYIQRITKREGNTNIRQGGSGGGGGGGVSQYWVDDNYVSKEFFNRLFEIHDENGDPILPNDVETEIDNIQAMFGFWTNAYLSALGNNPGGGGAELTLASLADVAVQGVANGQALVWNATLGKWVPGTGGIDLTAMWNALAGNTNQQINATHLTTALTGYATQSWVTQQGYLTASAISDMATQTWVGTQISDMATQTWVSTNYLSKTDAASTYLTKTEANTTYLSISFFRALFRAYTSGGSEVVPNGGSTSTIDNIKAMFGFWTNSYLSALGNNPGGASLTLASLADVAVQGVADGQALVWSASQGKWIPGQGGGIDITVMWAALAQSGVQQIDASHLATALTGYATETWVGNQGYITGSALNGYATESWVGSQISDMATETWVGNQGYITGSALNGYATESWVGSQISDMATQTWVGQNYLGLHATADAATKLATARTLWGQAFDGTANVSGSMMGVTSIEMNSDGALSGYGGFIDFHYSGSSADYTSRIIEDANGRLSFNSVLYAQYGGNVGIGTTPSSSYKLYVSGTFHTSGNSSIGGTFGVTGATTLSSTLGVTGNTTVGGTLSVTGATTLSSTLSVSGNSTHGGDIFLNSGGRIHIANEPSGSSLYIGNSNDAGWVYMSDMCSRQGNGYWKVYSNGNSEFANVYSRGYVTALSDIRHKDVKCDVGLTVREIANAPSVKFLWKDRRQEGLQVGSIAQYWQKVLPEAIVEAADGELTMSYGVIALLASIANAREIVNLKREIAELKRKLQKHGTL